MGSASAALVPSIFMILARTSNMVLAKSKQEQQQQEQHGRRTVNIVRPQQHYQQESQLDHLYSDISDLEVDVTPADDDLVITISDDDDQLTA